MKPFIILVSCFLIFTSCQDSPKQVKVTKKEPKSFPSELQQVFDAHGGYSTWDKMNQLSYNIVKEPKSEKQFIDLKTRRERISGSNFTMGFDGVNTWVEADTSYKGNPIFYKNLMFYFYAMPFVLGDDGINYSETTPVVFEDKNYPGIRISYNDSVGVSPKDEYFIHFDPTTKEMAWLGYTVTYFSKEKSSNIKWIRYNDWTSISDLKLPKSIDWYNSEDGHPTTFRNKVTFDNILLSENKPLDKDFIKTKNAEVLK